MALDSTIRRVPSDSALEEDSSSLDDGCDELEEWGFDELEDCGLLEDDSTTLEEDSTTTEELLDSGSIPLRSERFATNTCSQREPGIVNVSTASPSFFATKVQEYFKSPADAESDSVWLHCPPSDTSTSIVLCSKVTSKESVYISFAIISPKFLVITRSETQSFVEPMVTPLSEAFVSCALPAHSVLTELLDSAELLDSTAELPGCSLLLETAATTVISIV